MKLKCIKSTSNVSFRRFIKNNSYEINFLSLKKDFYSIPIIDENTNSFDFHISLSSFPYFKLKDYFDISPETMNNIKNFILLK